MAVKYANQYTVTIGNRLRDTSHPYVLMGIIPFQRACKDLNNVGEIKLWLYLSHHQDGFKFNLSQKACESWGIKKDSYYRAVDKLIEKGYLIPTEKEDNYIFTEIPEIKYDF